MIYKDTDLFNLNGVIMKKISILISLLFLFPSFACADDVLGVYAGVGFWTQNVEGFVDYNGSNVGLEDDLKLENDSGIQFYIAFEHFVPMLPNIKVAHSKISTTGTHVISESFVFDNVTYNVNESIDSKFQLDNTDLIFYYEVLDNWINLDLGLDVKVLNGNVQIYSQTTAQSASKSFDVPVPMLYAKAQIDVPATGLYISGEASAIEYDGSGVTDFKILAGYEFDYGLGFELGWRSFGVEIDDADGLTSDINVEGVFGNLRYHF